MNARHLAFAAITLLSVPVSNAQHLDRKPHKEPLLDDLGKFNLHEPAKPIEFPVVLEPMDDPFTCIQKAAKPAPAAEKPAAQPLPATHKPPEKSEPVRETEHPASEPKPEEPDASAPPSRQGLAVRVENIQIGIGGIDPSQVKLHAPFPAKPFAKAPVGWCYKSSENAPPFTREVELSPGNRITLTIRPHLLVPEADGTNIFNVREPGFDALLGFHQNATVSAILSHSIRQLEDDAKQLGITIDNLQQILVSLPKPQP
ncbi:MAG: hypothetical protein NTV46_19555 [Verrucomicrobia bacterium]|nr:hypothetical protein [Verrucomicrobiota bacterium]